MRTITIIIALAAAACGGPQPEQLDVEARACCTCLLQSWTEDGWCSDASPNKCSEELKDGKTELVSEQCGQLCEEECSLWSAQ